MENTRVEILKHVEAWTNNDTASKVYWLSGHLGSGKTTIAHTLCERLKDKLGASFFCSRSILEDVTQIIPTIATQLSQYDLQLQRAIYEVVASNPELGELNCPSKQFSSLIINPIKRVIHEDTKTYKVIVIDALDECSSSSMVQLLIKAIDRKSVV